MHSYKMQVFSEDTDMFGIVHHANYIKFMERARLTWLSDIGFNLDKLLAEGIVFVIKKIEIDYLAPARIYDQLDIKSTIMDKRRVAKTYQHIIHSAQNPDIVYCKAKIEVVCVDHKMRPRPMPEALLEEMS